MKLALFLLAFTTSLVAQTPTPPSTPPQTPAPAQTPATPPATPSVPTQTPPTGRPAAPPTPVANPTPPPPPEKIENHNGPAIKNPKSTLTKVTGLPHVMYSLRYVDIKLGTGPLAEPRKFYTVNYTGWFTDGTKFDSSFDHTPKEPITFPYGAQRVIIGWDTGFEGMRVGGKRRLYVPYQLAYGVTGRPPKMGPKANLIFDVELISQSDKPPTPPAGSRPPGRPAPGTPGVPGGMLPGQMRPVAPATPPAPGVPNTPPASPSPSAPATPSKPMAPGAPSPATPPATPPAPPSN